jgi:hypothetical protein
MLFTNIWYLIWCIFKMAPFIDKYSKQPIYVFQQIWLLTHWFLIYLFFFQSLKIFKKHHVRIFIFALILNVRPLLEHLHNLHIANHTELYRREKDLHSAFPDTFIYFAKTTIFPYFSLILEFLKKHITAISLYLLYRLDYFILKNDRFTFDITINLSIVSNVHGYINACCFHFAYYYSQLLRRFLSFYTFNMYTNW